MYESLKQLMTVSRGLDADNPHAGGIAGGIAGTASFLLVGFGAAKVSQDANGGTTVVPPRHGQDVVPGKLPVHTGRTALANQRQLAEEGSLSRYEQAPILRERLVEADKTSPGLPVSLFRVFISNVIQMWVYEWVRKHIRAISVDPPPPPRRPGGDL